MDSRERTLLALNHKEPDRVPVSINIDAMPMYEYGLDYNTGIHDYDKMRLAYNAFNQKHAAELEMFAAPPIMFPAKVYEILDYKQYAWPGHGLHLNGEGYQFVEGEYMTADEYDAFIRDPSDFWIRTFLPRAFGAFEPVRMFGSATTIIESIAGVAMLPLAMSVVVAASLISTAVARLKAKKAIKNRYSGRIMDSSFHHSSPILYRQPRLAA